MGETWGLDTQKMVMLFLLYFPPFPRIFKKKIYDYYTNRNSAIHS